MRATLFGTSWWTLTPTTRTILRAVFSDGEDMESLATRLGCSRTEATQVFIRAKQALWPTIGVTRHGSEPVTGEQFLLAFRRLPAPARQVAFEIIIAEETVAVAAGVLGMTPLLAFALYREALSQLRRMLPGL